MKISEILKIVVKEDHDISEIELHLEESLRGIYEIPYPKLENCSGVLHKTHGKWYYYAGRTWDLSSYWYKNQPVMITQNAGRSGEDYHKRFILNSNLYFEMLSYIESLIPNELTTYSLDYDNKEIIEFYSDNNLGKNGSGEK